jgi:hypothetical protein
VGCFAFVFLLLAIAFLGVGFAVHLFWTVAAIFFVFWLVGYAFGRGQRAANRRSRRASRR